MAKASRLVMYFGGVASEGGEAGGRDFFRWIMTIIIQENNLNLVYAGGSVPKPTSIQMS